MPSALVGTVILTLRGRGVGKTELVRRVNWLISMVKVKGGSVAEFHGMSTDEVVDRYVVQKLRCEYIIDMYVY